MKISYTTGVRTMGGEQVLFVKDDNTVMEQALAHKDIDAAMIMSSNVTHYFIPYNRIMAISVERNISESITRTDAFCTEE